MAATTVNTNNSTFLREVCQKLGFDDVRTVEDIASDAVLIEARVGEHIIGKKISNRLLASAPSGSGAQMLILKELREMARQVDHNNDHVMDLRYNSIESIDDFMALHHKARSENRRIDEAWITPEQKQVLLQQVDQTMLSSPDGQVVQLMGCKLRVEPQ